MALNWSKLLQMAQKGLQWLEMTPNASKHRQISPNGSKWLKITPNGLKWLQMAVKVLNYSNKIPKGAKKKKIPKKVKKMQKRRTKNIGLPVWLQMALNGFKRIQMA